MVLRGCLAGATTHILLHLSVQEDSREILVSLFFFLQISVTKEEENGPVLVAEVFDIQTCMNTMASLLLQGSSSKQSSGSLAVHKFSERCMGF